MSAGVRAGSISNVNVTNTFTTLPNSETEQVADTVLRVFGASNWTSTVTTRADYATVRLTNHSTSTYLYYKLIDMDATLAGSCSALLNDGHIAPRKSDTINIDENFDLAVVRDTGASAVEVTATVVK